MDLTGIFNFLNSAWPLLALLPLIGYIAWHNTYEFNSFADCIDSVGGNSATILISNEQKIEENDDIYAWITSMVIHGGFFNVSTGKTLNILGPLESGPHNIFQGAGAVVLGPNSIGEAKPEWWTDFPACIASLGARETTLLITHEWIFDNDLTIPATITLRFLQGGSFSVDNLKTVTVNGRVEAGLDQIFTGLGTVIVNTYPKEQLWWGAAQSLDFDKISWQSVPNIKLDDWATPDDNLDLNSTLTEHGLLPKLGGGAVNFLRADGTWNQPPAVWSVGFRAHRNAAQVLNNMADTRILWDVEDYDIGGDLTTIFTVPANGYYLLNTCVSVESMAAGTGVYLRFRKAGPTVLAQSRYTIPLGIQSYTLTAQLYLTAATWVEVTLFHNHGANRNITVGTTNSWFEGHRIDG